jgi:hypothetical protein
MRHLLAAMPVLLVLTLVHCSGSAVGIGDGGVDEGGSDAAVRNVACPNIEPTVGAACSLPAGITCGNYPLAAAPGCECCSSQSPNYNCSGGVWIAHAVATATPNIAAACPVTVPTQGEACGSPCGASITCSFDCAHGNGSISSATCVAGIWQVRQSLAPCGAADAGEDAADANDGH